MIQRVANMFKNKLTFCGRRLHLFPHSKREGASCQGMMKPIGLGMGRTTRQLRAHHGAPTTARAKRRAQGQATLPSIIRIDISEHYGEVDIKTAWFHRLDSVAVKMGSGFLDNPLRGRPMAAG